MPVLVNRAKMSTSTTGTGTITLGSAVSGFQTFADAGVSDGQIVRYVIEDGANFEIGNGTYGSSGTTLSRSVLESSNSDSAISLSGDAFVFIGAIARDITSDVAITGGSITGITDLVIADGGTGASTASAARDNLGLGTGDSPTFSTVNATNVVASNLMQANAISLTGSLGVLVNENIIFEGTTADNYEIFFTATDPTADRTITLPDATGTVLLADGDGSNLTGVQAASVDIDESTDDNVDYNIIFSDTTSSGSVQMTPQQDNNGITFNPSTNRLINGGIIQAGPRSDSDIIFQGYGGDSTSEYIAMGVQTGYANITAGGVGSTSTDLRIRTANSGTEADKVTIKADGKTGIGTTSPSEVLDVVGNIAVSGTVDGVDIAARDAILTSTTTTANAAMPKSGGTFTDDVTFEGAQYTNRNVVWDKTDSALEFADNAKIKLGLQSDLQIYHNAQDSYIIANVSGNLFLRNATDDYDVVIECDNGLGGTTNYLRADGGTGEVLLYHYGSEKLKTQAGGVDVTGNITVSGTVDGKDVSTLTTATAAADEATALAIALG
jgi:hypothetical protein